MDGEKHDRTSARQEEEQEESMSNTGTIPPLPNLGKLLEPSPLVAGPLLQAAAGVSRNEFWALSDRELQWLIRTLPALKMSTMCIFMLLFLSSSPAPSCPPVSQPHTSLAAITRWPHSRYLGAYMHFYVLILDNLRIWCSGFLYNLCVSNILVTRNHSNNFLVHCCEALMVLFTLEQALIDAPISKADKPLTKSDSCFMNAKLNK